MDLFDRPGLGADYEELHVVQDDASGLRAVIAVHSTSRGPAAGGIRRMRYASTDAAIADALRLAWGMTMKCAFAELPAGGAKTVILDREGVKREEAYRALGRAIERLGGLYFSGADVGTGEAELDLVREETRFVNPPSNDSNLATARGLVAALRGALAATTGDASVSGRRFLVQGLGGVGLPTARALRGEGAVVLGCDVSEAAREAARAVGVEVVPTEAATSTPCDVFVPCALGGVLTPHVARALPARLVCGSANNQLSDEAVGALLHERGVVYVPDFVANAGGVIEGVLAGLQGVSPEAKRRALAHVDATQARVEALLRESAARREPPHETALAIARRNVRRPRPAA